MNESIIYVSLCVLFRQWMNKWTSWAITRTLLEKKRNYLLQHTIQIQFASKTSTQIHYSELKEKEGKSSEVAYGARGGSRVLTTCWEEYPNEVHGSRGRPRHKLLKRKLRQYSAAQPPGTVRLKEIPPISLQRAERNRRENLSKYRARRRGGRRIILFGWERPKYIIGRYWSLCPREGNYPHNDWIIIINR